MWYWHWRDAYSCRESERYGRGVVRRLHWKFHDDLIFFVSSFLTTTLGQQNDHVHVQRGKEKESLVSSFLILL